MRTLPLSLCFLLAVVPACGGGDIDESSTASATDAASEPPDTAVPDEGAPVPDLAVDTPDVPEPEVDASDMPDPGSPPDGEGPVDVSDIEDTSPPDTSPPDTSPPDTSPLDTSPPDTSPPDTSPPDTSPPDEDCTNGEDDDLDGAVDCLDTDCAGLTACAGASCAQPIPVGAGTWAMDTTAMGDAFEGTCGGLGGVDVVFSLTLESPSDVLVTSAGSDYGVVLYLRAESCPDGAELACAAGAGGAAALALPALKPGTWFFVADAAPPGTGGALALEIVITPAGITPTLATKDDPLIWMPGSQPSEDNDIPSSSTCLACHSDYAPEVEAGFQWQGSMMANAAKDPLFWGSFAVAVQDSVWALGTPNGGDLCLRCHSPVGWLEGRSDPPNGSKLKGKDYEGVQCVFCHRLMDPFFEDTHAGVREGSDWLGYWDETNASPTPSSAAADATYLLDVAASKFFTRFDGEPQYTPANQPGGSGYTENGSGQYYLAPGPGVRGQLADVSTPVHQTTYSRYHKSRYYCSTCHDVSNPLAVNGDLAGAVPGDGAGPLPTEETSPFAYGHAERTFSEMMLSAYAAPAGAPGEGPFAPGAFETPLASNNVARCQDCHMRAQTGAASVLPGTPIRPTDSVEHPKTGISRHDLTGGNAWIPLVLASTVTGSPNFDAVNKALLNQGAELLTMTLYAGLPLDAAALLAASQRALKALDDAAAIEGATYDPATGALAFRIRNHTGHKLPTGYPEGRRMFVSIRALAGGAVLQEINPYDEAVGTLKGLDSSESPPLGEGQVYSGALVYEAHLASTLTGEAHTFHFVLATGRAKDNRIPPKGFQIDAATSRKAEPVWEGKSAPDLFTPAEYAGGWDDVALTIAPGADTVEVRLYYQTTSREYIAFLRDELAVGGGATLTSPTPAGRALAYIAQTDPYFSGLRAWGQTMWDLWEHNKALPGAAPVLMAEAVVSVE